MDRAIEDSLNSTALSVRFATVLRCAFTSDPRQGSPYRVGLRDPSVRIFYLGPGSIGSLGRASR